MVWNKIQASSEDLIPSAIRDGVEFCFRPLNVSDAVGIGGFVT